jgi:DNA-binding CsgD family transcriptional regulator
VSLGDYEGAYAAGVACANVAAELGYHAFAAEGWLLAGMSRCFAGENGLSELWRGLDLAIESGDPGAVGHAYRFLADQLTLAGERDRSLELAMEGIDATNRLGVAGTHGSDIRGYAGQVLLDAGRWTEADAVLGPADRRAIPSLVRALLAMRRGAFDAADDELAASAVGASIGGPGTRGGYFEMARAELAWLRGDTATAREQIRALVLSYGVWAQEAGAWRRLWQARLGMPPTEPRLRHPDIAVDAAIDAEISAEGEGGVEAWRGAAEAWATLGWPYHAGWARLREAEAGFARQGRSEARAALDEVARIAEDLGAGPLRARAEDLARRARVAAATPRRAAPDPTELTPREREVLAHLAEGRTNRQIGEALFVSPKTVELHVSRILDKLGAKTRGEAVAVARRAGHLPADAVPVTDGR